MLLDFTVENYRSFYQKRTLDLQSQKLSEEAKNNVAQVSSYSILKTLAVYGANSSGKSNLIKALQMMEICILSSVKLNPNDPLPYEPFLLLKDNAKPTLFEISFFKDGYCFRYGFRYTETEIIDEWLYRKTTKRSVEQALFIRNKEGFAFEEKKFPDGVLVSKVNNNRLFLSLCAQLGGDISSQVISWFETDFNVVFGLNNQKYRKFSKMQFHRKNDTSKKALAFFQKLQLGFNEIATHEEELSIPEHMPKEFLPLLTKEMAGEKSIEIESVHTLYNDKKIACDQISFPFDERESSGTRKLFDMSGPIFDTLERGAILVIDELDAKMHPLISQQIIQLFNNPTTNPYNAQLIFTTHDTHLLSSKMLRRDQIWFTEKNEVEQTDLYCLTDIVLPDGTKPRNDANYEKNYIAGRYGAIPYIINE